MLSVVDGFCDFLANAVKHIVDAMIMLLMLGALFEIWNWLEIKGH